MNQFALPPPPKSWQESLRAWLRTPAATIVVGAAGVGGVLTLVLITASDAAFFASGSLAFMVVAGISFLAVVTLVVFRVFLPAQYPPAVLGARAEDELTPAERDMEALAAQPGGLAAQTPGAVARLVARYYDGRRIVLDSPDPVPRLLDSALSAASLDATDQAKLDDGLEALWAAMAQGFRDGNVDRRAKAKAVMFAIELYRRTVQRYLNAKRGRT